MLPFDHIAAWIDPLPLAEQEEAWRRAASWVLATAEEAARGLTHPRGTRVTRAEDMRALLHARSLSIGCSIAASGCRLQAEMARASDVFEAFTDAAASLRLGS